MKGPKVPPWSIRALLCAIVPLFILTGLVSGQGAQEMVPNAGEGPMTAEPAPPAQLACTYAISPAEHSVSSVKETGSISVRAPDNCDWTARSDSPWIAVGPNAKGRGNGTITYSVGANPAAAGRVGMIAIAGQVFQVAQTEGPVIQYALTMSRAGSGRGAVSSRPAGKVFRKGTWVAVRAVPDDGSVFAGWNGTCPGTSASCNLQMTSDRTVTATFKLKTYIIHVPVPFNGMIHPSGTIKATHGEKRRFQVIPLPGYRISDVLVDKASVGAVNSYTFDNVRADHVLEAVFVKQ